MWEVGDKLWEVLVLCCLPVEEDIIRDGKGKVEWKEKELTGERESLAQVLIRNLPSIP